MCKCSNNTTAGLLKRSMPYCYREDCRPSKGWERASKDCPLKKAYETCPGAKEKTDMCRSQGLHSRHFRGCSGSGDWFRYFCSEQNCAPWHFFIRDLRHDLERSRDIF